eukprot:PRCOL_00006409-RA
MFVHYGHAPIVARASVRQEAPGRATRSYDRPAASPGLTWEPSFDIVLPAVGWRVDCLRPTGDDAPLEPPPAFLDAHDVILSSRSSLARAACCAFSSACLALA